VGLRLRGHAVYFRYYLLAVKLKKRFENDTPLASRGGGVLGTDFSVERLPIFFFHEIHLDSLCDSA